MMSPHVFTTRIVNRSWNIWYPLKWAGMQETWGEFLRKHARGGDVKKVRAFEKIEHKYGMLFSWRDGKQECPTCEMFDLIRVLGESRKDIRSWR
jgi:hypothetical protein